MTNSKQLGLVSAEVPLVGAVITRNLLTCGPDTPLAEAAAMMRAARCSSIVVTENDRAVGIWTERDALRLDYSNEDAFSRPMREVMTTAPKCIDADAGMHEAGLLFRRDRIRHLVVVENERPIGMLSQTDVVLNHGVEHYLTFRDVRSVMSDPPPILPADTSVSDAARLLSTSATDAAIVAPGAEGEDHGIVTERDLVRVIAERQADATVGSIATRPIISVAPGSTLLAARTAFAHHRIRHLAVRDQDHFVGLLSFADILNILEYEYVDQLNGALRERDEALIRSRKDLLLARQVIEESLEAVMIVDHQGQIEYVNPAFTTLTGYEAEEVLGKNPSMLQSDMQDDAFYRQLWADLHEQGHWRGEMWNRRKNGEIFAEHLSISTIRGDDGRITKYAALFSDITDRKRHEEQVTRLAYYDPLTGLPNRRLLIDRLNMALAAAHRHMSPLAVLFLDLDLFKRINDTLGHDVGDAVLNQTAQRLQDAVREIDTVARLGGDEFVVLLPELASVKDAALLAQRLIEAVCQPIEVNARSLYVTTSIGIAVYPGDSREPEMLLKRADQAMYAAKQLGRNKFRFAADVPQQRTPHNDLAARLQHAVENKALSLAYQVKVDLITGAVSGAEALVRWNDPELGPVPPSDFLPVAEKSGLMRDLGRWVVAEACAQNKRWQDQGLPPVPIAVNLSSFEFRDVALADHVLSVLSATGLDPHYLELEINESAILEHPKEVREVLTRVHAVGVEVCIDDFGSRYSSLGALRQLPISTLKVDRSLIEGIGHPFDDKDLVGAIVQMARALNMRVVAEGVETTQQAEFLCRAGCDEIQGWLVSRPVSADEVENLFRRRLLPELAAVG